MAFYDPVLERYIKSIKSQRTNDSKTLVDTEAITQVMHAQLGCS